MRQGPSSGFSLIELIVAMIILGILGVILAPQLMDRPQEARVTKAVTEIRALQTALRFYKLDNGRYPTTEQGIEALIKEPTTSPEPLNYRKSGYLETENLPLDPWGHEYIYRSPGSDDRDYEIISLGADGEEGGEDFDKDIESWNLTQ